MGILLLIKQGVASGKGSDDLFTLLDSLWWPQKEPTDIKVGSEKGQ